MAEPGDREGDGAAGRHPPRVPFTAAVGITGHRLEAIPTELRQSANARIAGALRLIKQEALALFEAERRWFSDDPARLILVSPLADGADQFAAEAGLPEGYALQAILPFAAQTYADDFGGEKGHGFAALLARAERVLELSGERDDPARAYQWAGRATVAHCDLLVALWDGLPARGGGGTGDIVSLALRRGTPVLHLPIQDEVPPVLLWSAFDPSVPTEGHSPQVRRPFDSASCGEALRRILAPPPIPQERALLARFLSERRRQARLRIEYPVLLTLAGAHRLSLADCSNRPSIRANADEWKAYRERCSTAHGVAAEIAPLETAYAWSDTLAGSYAQGFRSSHVFNFLAAATAGVVGATGFLWHVPRQWLAMVELLIIAMILFNTLFGARRRWQQRWLDYRQLAERLRPMRSLKLLGVAAPDPPGSPTNPVARRWIEWYAAAMWRAMGCPSGQIERARSAALSRAIGEAEVQPQIAYNRQCAGQAVLIERRLNLLAIALFVLTTVNCIALVIALSLAPDWVATHGDWLSLVATALPAIGTAIFGIRVQGDYAGTASRAERTATELVPIEAELARTGGDLGRAADLTEQAARVMSVDLGDWRLIQQQHELAVG